MVANSRTLILVDEVLEFQLDVSRAILPDGLQEVLKFGLEALLHALFGLVVPFVLV
jgi:hypothetical protein